MSRSRSVPEELIKIKAHQIWEERLLKGKDGTPESDWVEAKKYLEKYKWEVFLWRLNQPFIWVEKRVVEPLDFWADRANIFSFFSKLSPIIEAIGVLAIPIVIFYFEDQREERQLRFEENLISAQTEVRHQQAVRDYLSQITTIHLETEQGRKIRDDEELKTLLEATTLAVFNELSVSEGSSREADNRKGQVVQFLSGLGWINGLKEEEPLLSLRSANLRSANLINADLIDADLREADLRSANLIDAELIDADLREADLRDANLIDAELRKADLRKADLRKADLKDANLGGALLTDADLREADLRDANLGGADLINADLREANLKDASLKDAYLDRANLKDANLGGAQLSDAVFFLANLRDANLGGAQLVDARLVDAQLVDADLREADLYEAKLNRANLDRANLNGANLKYANLSGARNLNPQQIKSTCSWKQAIFFVEWNEEVKFYLPKEPDNTNYIEELKKDKSTDPEEPVDCSRWSR